MRRPINFLVHIGPMSLREAFQPHRFTRARGFIDRFDHAHVGQALLAGRLRLTVVENAIRKICDFGGELVAFGKRSLCRPFPDGDFKIQAFGILVSRIGG